MQLEGANLFLNLDLNSVQCQKRTVYLTFLQVRKGNVIQTYLGDQEAT